MWRLPIPPVSLVDDLLHKQYFLIPVPETLEQLYVRAHELWAILCNYYGEKGLRQFSFELYVGDLAEGLSSEVDDGYLPRGGVRPEDGVKYDAKHTWHHRPRLWEHMRATRAFDDPVMGYVWKEFMLVNQSIWDIHRDAVMHFADGLDTHSETREFGFAEDLELTMWLMPLRHVLYIPGEKKESFPGRRDARAGVVGQAHQDRNSFTFHGFQKVGKVQGFIDDKWVDMPVRCHHLRGFAGILAAQRTGGVYSRKDRKTTGGRIPALDHVGVADPTRPMVPRRASVSFGMHKAYRIQ
jgi:hypothetical protein